MYKALITKKTIDNIFKNAKHQSEVVVALYRNVFGSDYSNIRKLHGFPYASRAFNDYMFKKFIEFDKIHHPDIFAGGTWLNHGFSTAEIENISLDSPWEVKWIDEKKIEWAENILEVANG